MTSGQSDGGSGMTGVLCWQTGKHNHHKLFIILIMLFNPI